MKRLYLTLALIIATSSPAKADEATFQNMTFEHVITGQTFVASGRTIRLWGIAAPEEDHPSGYASKLFLESLLETGELTCKLMRVDSYQQNIMHCLVDGLDVGSMMVQVGMAVDDETNSGSYYSQEERLAKEKAVGIWKNPVSERL